MGVTTVKKIKPGEGQGAKGGSVLEFLTDELDV